MARDTLGRLFAALADVREEAAITEVQLALVDTVVSRASPDVRHCDEAQRQQHRGAAVEVLSSSRSEEVVSSQLPDSVRICEARN